MQTRSLAVAEVPRDAVVFLEVIYEYNQLASARCDKYVEEEEEEEEEAKEEVY